MKDLRKELNETHKPIIISDDSDGKISGFECKWCNRIIRSKFTDDSIWCNSCQSETIIYKDIKPVKKGLKAEVVDNSEVFVTSVQPNFDDMAGHTKYGKPTELKDGALALSKKGTIRFTSYYDSSEVKENAD
jgi:DNA-directed RNA polymerase subunit RPC12/RpoP